MFVCFPYIQALCKLAIDYGSLTGQSSVVEQAATVLRSAEWGKHLSKYKVGMQDGLVLKLCQCLKLVGLSDLIH